MGNNNKQIIRVFNMHVLKFNNVHGSVFIRAWCAQPQFNTIITDLKESGVEPRLIGTRRATRGLGIVAL